MGQEASRARARPWAALALAGCLAAPAGAHLLARGAPLAELAAASPVVVWGRVTDPAPPRDPDGAPVTAFAVERAVVGELAPGALRVVHEGHHPPAYRVGEHVLVFLATSGPPWLSRQTELDRVEVPADEAEREALLAAVRAYADLSRAPARREQVAHRKALSLAHLESASERVRREALLDLLSLTPTLDPGDVERIAALALRPDTPATLAPGLVALLDAARGPHSLPALRAVLREAPQPRARALAAQAVGRRRDAGAVPALGASLADPALEVRLTARRALETIASPAARAALARDTARESEHSTLSTGRE